MRFQDISEFVLTKEFAYFMGFFAADGSFYSDGRNTRFEFVDGTSVIDELKYSKDFITITKIYLEQLLNKELPNLRKRNNKYVLQFRSKKLDDLFRKIGYLPGPKTFTINIPSFYVGTHLEKSFWVGIMDGDGMVARDNKKISLESVSRELISSFKLFLDKNGVVYKFRVRRSKIGTMVYGVYINSLFFNTFLNLLPFQHPRKKLWCERLLIKKDFYINNSFDYRNILFDNKVINYFKIFEKGDIFVVNGCKLLNKNLKRKNSELFSLKNELNAKDYDDLEIMYKLKSFRFKAGKGSIKSVRKPLKFNDDLNLVSKYVRVVDGGLRISTQYIEAHNENADKIISNIVKVFDIRPSRTGKGEYIFSSVVLNKFFKFLFS